MLFRIFKRRPEWESGTFRNGQRARRHQKTGVVQFVMWKAGEQGHSDDYWINANDYWWDTFVPTDNDKKNQGQP